VKKKLLYLIIPAIVYSDNLQELLNHAHSNNQIFSSKKLMEKSIKSEIDAAKSLNSPTIDVGGFYKRLDERTQMLPGDISSAYVKVSYDIYDGNKKESSIKHKQNKFKASKLDTNYFKKSLSLQIVQDYFNIKNIEASLLALDEQKNSLQAQLTRVKKFYEAQLSTKDDIDKLQSAYDTNVYNIQSLKFNRLTFLQSLQLKVSKEIKSLDDVKFKKELKVPFEINESIKSLQAKQNSIINQANMLNGTYKPQVNISNTFNLYNYSRTDDAHPAGLDSQNTLLLSVNLRLYDDGTVSKNKQAITISAKSIAATVNYKIAEQKMLFNLSQSRITTNELKIKSAYSALQTATSSYETINEKYRAGIVDNISFLDALSVKTNAKSLYERSLNDLEVAYAMYYFYAGKNIEKYIEYKDK